MTPDTLFKLKSKKLLPKRIHAAIESAWKSFTENNDIWCYASENECERIKNLCQQPKDSGENERALVVLGDDDGTEYDYAMENMTPKGIYQIAFLNPAWQDIEYDEAGHFYLLDCRGYKIDINLVSPRELDLCPECLNYECQCEE